MKKRPLDTRDVVTARLDPAVHAAAKDYNHVANLTRAGQNAGSEGAEPKGMTEASR